MIRSIVAVVAGLVTLTALSFGIEAIVGAENKPLMFAYSFLSIVAGGSVTARLAPRNPIRHAVIMGAIQAFMTFDTMFVMRDSLPPWAWVVSILSTVPATWLGAKLARAK